MTTDPYRTSGVGHRPHQSSPLARFVSTATDLDGSAGGDGIEDVGPNPPYAPSVQAPSFALDPALQEPTQPTSERFAPTASAASCTEVQEGTGAGSITAVAQSSSKQSTSQPQASSTDKSPAPNLDQSDEDRAFHTEHEGVFAAETSRDLQAMGKAAARQAREHAQKDRDLPSGHPKDVKTTTTAATTPVLAESNVATALRKRKRSIELGEHESHNDTKKRAI